MWPWCVSKFEPHSDTEISESSESVSGPLSLFVHKCSRIVSCEVRLGVVFAAGPACVTCMDADTILALQLQQEELEALERATLSGDDGVSSTSGTRVAGDCEIIVLDDNFEQPHGNVGSSAVVKKPDAADKKPRKPHVPGEWKLPAAASSSLGLHLPGHGAASSAAELADPTPDVHAMFLDFNARFFHGRLDCVELRWSKRMTLCAGLCVYEGKGGLCSVRLSHPLLSMRPRRDLVDTLLHEMIHAWEFLTRRLMDHDGHGPEFLRIAKEINTVAGTNITVYHNFHDEVEAHRRHWWRCEGPCMSKPPHFGYVKRAMNRAPSEKDWWWPDHKATCGGAYVKVKEPSAEEVKAEKDRRARARKEQQQAAAGSKRPRPALMSGSAATSSSSQSSTANDKQSSKDRKIDAFFKPSPERRNTSSGGSKAAASSSSIIDVCDSSDDGDDDEANDGSRAEAQKRSQQQQARVDGSGVALSSSGVAAAANFGNGGDTIDYSDYQYGDDDDLGYDDADYDSWYRSGDDDGVGPSPSSSAAAASADSAAYAAGSGSRGGVIDIPTDDEEEEEEDHDARGSGSSTLDCGHDHVGGHSGEGRDDDDDDDDDLVIVSPAKHNLKRGQGPSRSPSLCGSTPTAI